MANPALEALRRRWQRFSQPGQAQLRIHQPGQASRLLPLHPGAYGIGRDSDCQISIDHQAVSRRHALLERCGPHWLLSDQNSTNGLWWQGRRVRQLLLRDGDSLRFGPSQEAGLPELDFQIRPLPQLQRLLRGVSWALAGMATGGLGLLALSVVQAPIRGSLATVRGPLVLYDRQGKPITTADALEHRERQALRDYPAVLIDALLASEDSRFWWHPGVDPVGTARALVTNVLGGRVLEGGSTLTQQLARSLYPDQVGQGETLGRKWRELLVALQLEARFSKRDLLLSYLNRVYLGVGWGFEDASRHYFGKPASQLQREEAALLVGLLPSPNGYDPCFDPQAALEARNAVLSKMGETGRLTADQARSGRRSPIRLSPQACRSSPAQRGVPFYSDQVRRDLDQLVGRDVAAEGNFLIDTHLDRSLQEQVERLLRQRLQSSAGLRVSEGAVVVLDARSGGILAIAGGRDYRQSQFNRASMALRQPGSTFKLIPYLVALERGLRPEDRISCAPFRWRGQSFASGCSGSLSLVSAFAISSNTSALRLAQRVGLDALVQKARDLGITSPLAAVPGLALGQSEVTLLELTAAYAAIANDGIWHAPTTIRRLTDAEACSGQTSSQCRQTTTAGGGSGTGQAPAQPGRQVITLATAQAMQQMLRAVVQRGTGQMASLGGQEGGKTGTTNESRDLLFVGYEPQRNWVVGIWLGNDDNSPTRASSALAASLWGEILRASRT
ncbi:transglycosylase domain-containing protein [Cyanobium sp. Alchichica 3B3-8F6]|uniref:transglycosylase domain-containing protein n=1 Tax=Cyanobium sp. Alchichica 3B3-8F6 TaxID=2823696 RepID=UPI0020CCFCA4|nr:transglycosylase domain-containing protein [Cyanobium sp. Alchichica 3B3-8F6]MCP9882202.1 transglycosylase domain-containing protein [Cyanobium sp. Alchichica 3B3-8F6]